MDSNDLESVYLSGIKSLMMLMIKNNISPEDIFLQLELKDKQNQQELNKLTREIKE